MFQRAESTTSFTSAREKRSRGRSKAQQAGVAFPGFDLETVGGLADWELFWRALCHLTGRSGGVPALPAPWPDLMKTS